MQIACLHAILHLHRTFMYIYMRLGTALKVSTKTRLSRGGHRCRVHNRSMEGEKGGFSKTIRLGNKKQNRNNTIK